MNNEIDMYLEKVSNGLSRLPETDKNEIIQEIKNHIYEAINKQESLQKVLYKLGEPLKLAQSYRNTYSLENNNLRLVDILNNIAFYGSVAFSGMFIIPFLGVMSVAFVLCSIFIMGVAVLNMISVTNIPFNIGFAPVTGVWQIIVAIVMSIVFCLLANASWVGLKRYMKFVANKYRKKRIGK